MAATAALFGTEDVECPVTGADVTVADAADGPATPPLLTFDEVNVEGAEERTCVCRRGNRNAW